MNLKILVALKNHKRLSVTLAAALILGFFVILITLALWKSRRLEIARAQATANNTNLLINSYFDGVFLTADAVLRGIALKLTENPNFCASSRVECTKLIAFFLPFASEVTDIFFANKNGEVLVRQVDDIKKGVSIFDREYFLEHQRNPHTQLIISKPVKGKISDQWLLTLSRRLTDHSGNFLGVVFGTIHLSTIEKFLKKFEIGPNGSISVFSADNYTLMVRFPVTENLIGKEVKNSSVYDLFKSSREPEGQVTNLSALDGINRYNKYRLNQKLGLIIVAGVAESDFLAEWRKHAVLSAASFIALTIIGIYFLIQLVSAQATLVEIRQNMLYSERMAVLGEMAGGVAHEVNNPLAIIVGKSQLAIRKIESGKFDSNSALTTFKTVEETAGRIVKIVRGLKLFSRDAGSDPKTLCQLESIIADSLNLCTERFKKHKIELRLEKIVEEKVSCRPSQISQVVLNLLNNSFDAIEDLNEKWVSLESRIEPVSGSEQVGKARKIVLAISDSGSGISPKIVNKIMDPFFSTKPVGKGTGLGLSISKGIIAEHGGQLYLDQTCKNTRFVIELPVG